MSNPNNPFGIPNEMFDAIIASAIMGSVAPGMKKPNPDAGAKKLTSGRCKSCKENL